MSCMSYNCRGVGRDATVREIRDLKRRFNPTIFCVLETQVHKARVEGLASTLGYDHSFAISSSGRSGGIGLFWTNEIKIDILPYSQYHLDVKITEAERDP